jgi:poly-gamma-glutamate capsule biosynthesis protein CapA/YwtB (metallophosphatase superfamily)
MNNLPSPGSRRSGWRSRAARPAIATAAVVGVVAVAVGVLAVAVRGPGADGGDRIGRTANSLPPPVTLPVRPTSGPPSPSPSQPPPGVDVVAVGDVIMGSTPTLPPDGGRSFFAQVTAALRGDVVLGNLEGALTDDTGYTKCGPGSDHCYAFRMPPSYAGLLRAAGFTVINLANNHSHDFGPAGLRNTQDALRAAGVDSTGLPGHVARTTVGGLRVAVLGFAPYSWAESLLDIPAAQRAVRAAAADADLVVVTMHAGAEGADQGHTRPGAEIFLGENRGDPIAFAHAVIDAGADLVVGHGPHVLRGAEWYRGRLVAYSLGNFAGYRTLSTAGPLGVSAVLRVSLAADGSWRRGSLVPTRMVGAGTPDLDPQRRAVGAVTSLSSADFGRCGVRVAADGTLAPPTC